MTQIEFVTELEQALRGNVEERIIQENVRYYNDYISEQRAAGKSEEEIFASLGSPRLIAKTIIDTSGVIYALKTVDCVLKTYKSN